MVSPTYIPGHNLQILLSQEPVILARLHHHVLYIETLFVSRLLIVDFIYIFSKIPEDSVLNSTILKLIKRLAINVICEHGRFRECKPTCLSTQSTSHPWKVMLDLDTVGLLDDRG